MPITPFASIVLQSSCSSTSGVPCFGSSTSQCVLQVYTSLWQSVPILQLLRMLHVPIIAGIHAVSLDKTDVYIDLSSNKLSPIDVFCEGAFRPQWFYQGRLMPMESTEVCNGVSEQAEQNDYFCPDRLHIAKPGARHAGVYECRDMWKPAEFAKVYVQSETSNCN